MIITIDGPAGTGKSTVAKKVAARLGFAFFDTGAMYRAVAWMLLQKKISAEDTEAIHNLLQDFHFEVADRMGQKYYSVNGIDVTASIRTSEVTAMASSIAVLPVVREVLWLIQRQFALAKDAVFEGRDMGSSVFPDAELRVFLTARAEVRAERRLKEMIDKGIDTTLSKEEVLQGILERDARDSTRACAPLQKVKGMIEIDTSDLDIDQVVTVIIEHVR